MYILYKTFDGNFRTDEQDAETTFRVLTSAPIQHQREFIIAQRSSVSAAVAGLAIAEILYI